MALEHEVLALATQADQMSKRHKLLRSIARRDSNRIRAYRRLLLDDKGDLTADAAAVIADLGRVARMGVADGADASDTEIRILAGRRAMVLHILARLDLGGEKLRKLADIIRESRHE